MSTHRSASDIPAPGKQLTGRKVLLIFLAFFGVILTANMTLLYLASGSFPGLVVKNSYVASQEWDSKAAAQKALGWTTAAEYRDGVLMVTISGRDGAPVTGLSVTAIAGRPASDRDDMRLELAATAQGYTAPLALAPGTWQVAITGTDASGNSFQSTARFYIQTPG
jgi:nitrogen fixation protein FixH